MRRKRRGRGRPAKGATAWRPPRPRVDYVRLLSVGLLFIVLGLFQLAPGCRAHLEDRRFAEDGVVVEATVTAKPSGKRTWRVEYQFSADSRVVEGKDRMDLSKWMGLQIGGPVTVVYLRSRPESNRLLAQSDDDVLFGAAVASVGLALLAVAAYWRMRDVPGVR
jgi:hypothetical protein